MITLLSKNKHIGVNFIILVLPFYRIVIYIIILCIYQV